MIKFPRPNGGSVTIPVQGVQWSNGSVSLTIVDSGYKGRQRYAVVNGDTVVGYAPTMDVARTICQRQS